MRIIIFILLVLLCITLCYTAVIYRAHVRGKKKIKEEKKANAEIIPDIIITKSVKPCKWFKH